MFTRFCIVLFSHSYRDLSGSDLFTQTVKGWFSVIWDMDKVDFFQLPPHTTPPSPTPTHPLLPTPNPPQPPPPPQSHTHPPNPSPTPHPPTPPHAHTRTYIHTPSTKQMTKHESCLYFCGRVVHHNEFVNGYLKWWSRYQIMCAFKSLNYRQVSDIRRTLVGN